MGFSHVLCDNGPGLWPEPVLVSLAHGLTIRLDHDHNDDHMVLDRDDDKQSGDQESPQRHHRRRHLQQLDHFLAGSAVFAVSLAAGASLLTGVTSAFL